MTKRLGIFTAVIAAIVAGGFALGLGLMSSSHATAAKSTPAARTTTSTTAPPTTTPATTPLTTVPPPTIVPPPPTTVPPPAPAPALVNGIPQANGGDQDPDNNGGPNDGAGNL